MVEDAPQDLVHDLLSEAVFSDHPLGRPVIGRAEVISSISRRSISSYHRRAYVAGNVVLAAAGNLEHDQLLGLLERAARQRVEPPAQTHARPVAARPRAGPGHALPAKGHRAVPRLHRRARHLALRPPPVRRLAPRRDPRRLGVVAALPGDPREAWAWPTRSTASARSTRTRASSASTSARARRTSPRASRSSPSRSPTSPPATCATRELQRAKENLKGRIALSMESTSNRMSRLGRSLITDTELLSLDRIIAEIDAVEPDGDRRARRRAARPGAALGGGDRAERGALPRRGRARPPGAGGRRMRVIVFGYEGKVGAAMAAGARRGRPRGARRRDRRRRCPTAPTRRSTSPSPTRSSRTSSAVSSSACRSSSGRPAGRPSATGSTPPPGNVASPSSSRRTSRSAPC